jgi:hypothetical protein
MANSASIKSRKDFKKTPHGWYERWDAEMQAANKRVKAWHKIGRRIDARFKDKRGEKVSVDISGSDSYRLNLFNSNIVTLRAMLYGQSPRVDVSRRFADSNDDEARVSAEILERMLNTSIETSGDTYTDVLRYCLDDRLLPGMGVARVRYEFKTEVKEEEVIETDPESGEMSVIIQENTEIVEETAPVDYVHWDDIRWGWARTWTDVPWVSFRAFMTRDELEDRFEDLSEEDIDSIPMMTPSEQKELQDSRQTNEETTDAWQRAEIWEIWDKTSRKVFWYCYGFDKVLDSIDDPLGLYGFFPCPMPMVANLTTQQFLPQPDFVLAQDLYNEIDTLETRIGIITKAVRVVGVYDQQNDEIKRMFQEGTDNMMIPVENWAIFSEKGGLGGQIDWFPIADVAAALEKLVQMRDDAIQLLFQVTGMSEILRGGAGPDRETEGANARRGKFSSIRIQYLQDEFSRFASDLMILKAEVIAKHFQPSSIAKQSNIGRSFDADIAPKAIELIKTSSEAAYRIEVRPESIAMIDYAQLKAERTAYIEALALFLQSSVPLVQLAPQATPILLQMLKWGMAGFKGSQEIEGILDKVVEQLQQSGQQDQGQGQESEADKQLKADKAKSEQKMAEQKQKFESDMQKENLMHKHKLEQIAAEAQSDASREVAQADAAAEETRVQTDGKVTEILTAHEARLTEIEETHRARLAEIETSEEEKRETAVQTRPKDTKAG